MALYFAYGDLLDSNVLRSRLGIAPEDNVPAPIAPARLPGYKLLFRKLVAADSRAFPDLMPDPAATVYGALFDLTRPQLDLLDKPTATDPPYKADRRTVIPYLPQRGPIEVEGGVV